jgi:hypothetical protein
VERQIVLIWTATGGHLDRYPTQDARRFVDGFTGFLDSRHPEVLASIRETGELPEGTEATMKEPEAFEASFVSSGVGAGSESAMRSTTPPHEVKPDVGWDRMSSVDDDEGAEKRDTTPEA